MDLLGGKDGAGEIVCHDRGDVIGIGDAEDQDRQRHAVFAKLDALLGDRDGEHIDKTGFFEIPPDLHDAVPVGVGLDDRKEFRFRLQVPLGKANVLQKRG